MQLMEAINGGAEVPGTREADTLPIDGYVIPSVNNAIKVKPCIDLNCVVPLIENIVLSLLTAIFA